MLSSSPLALTRRPISAMVIQLLRKLLVSVSPRPDVVPAVVVDEFTRAGISVVGNCVHPRTCKSIP